MGGAAPDARAGALSVARASHGLAAREAAHPGPMQSLAIAVHTADDSADEASAVPWPAFYMEEQRPMVMGGPAGPIGPWPGRGVRAIQVS